LPAGLVRADDVVIGSITRFSAIKAPLNLVEAFIMLRGRANVPSGKLRLAMAGDGELRPAALARLEEARASSVSWLPGSRDDVSALLKAMDVFVLSSLREGISNTILEAMAAGLPVVATRTGGNPELVTSETGVLVPPGDVSALAAAVEAYAQDPDRRREHGRRGRERVVAEFSIETMLAGYDRLYGRALGKTDA